LTPDHAGTVLVVGGGAAGLMAAGQAAAFGARVLLLERHAEPGRKLLISGKGRCNLAHQAGVQSLVAGLPGNGRFLFSAMSAFGPDQLRGYLAGLGVETKVERGNRVFPVSDDAATVRDALLREALAQGADLKTGERVDSLLLEDGPGGRRRVLGAQTTSRRTYLARSVILATGGLSYPATGSTGDGYRLAASAGHSIVRTAPSLVPLVTAETWPGELSGLGLRNVGFRAWKADPGSPRPDDGSPPAGGRSPRRRPRGALADEFGELLFTHFGLSGPIVLRASRAVSKALAAGAKSVPAEIDLKPALSFDVLDKRVQRDFLNRSNRQFRNSLGELMPSSLCGVVVALTGIDPAKRVRDVTREERLGLVGLLKRIPLTIVGTRGFSEAIVTCGGVDVREVWPATMESRLVAGLYFAGEVLDVDGYTGGFNLQAAFSTGYAAARAAAAEALSAAPPAAASVRSPVIP
jgi:hypothetical protein